MILSGKMTKWKKGRMSGPTKEALPLPDVVKIDMSVDSKFTVDGIKYTVTAAEYCNGCGFRDKVCPQLACSAVDRSDGCSVSFVKEEQ